MLYYIHSYYSVVALLSPLSWDFQDTFYVDPNVEGCECLTARARRLGLKTKGFLGEGVTVCVAATSRARKAEEGGQSRGRRRDRIHRMVRQHLKLPLSCFQDILRYHTKYTRGGSQITICDAIAPSRKSRGGHGLI